MTFSAQPNKTNVLGYISRGLCVYCGREVKYFGDAVSRKHYERTGMCQECQNKHYDPRR